MAATNVSAESLLNYLPLTEAVNLVMADLPKPLPDVFYTQTKDVPGDTFRRFLFSPTRKTSRRAIRGSPPRRVDQTVVRAQDARMVHTIEEIGAGPEIDKLFHGYTSWEPVQFNAEEELERRAQDFARRQVNFRTAAIHSVIANGYLWFDVDGYLLGSSVGAAETVDYLIPSGNRIASPTSWATDTFNIPNYISNLLTTILQTGGGRKPRLAITGANITGYLSANLSFREYLARSQDYRENYIDINQIKPGTLGLTWVPAQDAYFEREDGTIVSQFPADQITLMPEPTRDIWELKQGSQPVPKEFGCYEPSGSFRNAIAEMMRNPVYGPFRYALGRPYPVPEVIIIQGDNFLPDMPVPASVVFLDTTP